MPHDDSRSAALYEQALAVLPGGVSRNTVLRKPYPLYVDHASGARVTDVEGVERIDFSNNMTSLIHGHAHPAIVSAVTEQLARGTAFTLPTEVEVRFAQHMVGRNESFDKIRFVNSGTEAVMGALKAARAFTGRHKIAKVEGAYHGLYDFAEISQTSTPANWGERERPASVPVSYGTPTAVIDDVVVIPFNDVGAAVAVLNEHRGDLACVILDLMPHRVGLNPAADDFVAALRDWTTADGALLVLDEVITFRSAYGGAQEWYDISADLVSMGKAIGGGFPVGAIAGRRDVMDVMNPLVDEVLFPHSGTFSGNPVTMTAGLATMELFDHQAVAHVNALQQRAVSGIEQAIARTGISSCVTGRGSILRVHLKDQPPANYREAFADAAEIARRDALVEHLFDAGFLMINTCSAAMSTAMTEDDIDSLVEALEASFKKVL